STTPPRFGLSPIEGDPSKGALSVGGTYSSPGQYVDMVVNLSRPLDLSGKVLHAKVKLVAVLDPGLMLNAQLHATSTMAYIWANSADVPLVAGEWLDATLDTGTIDVPGWDARSVVQIGVKVYSVAAAAGATFAQFEIDTVQDM